jgi:hypothetical protein
MTKKEIKRRIIELNYDLLLALTYDEQDKIIEIREETNELIKEYLNNEG